MIVFLLVKQTVSLQAEGRRASKGDSGGGGDNG